MATIKTFTDVVNDIKADLISFNSKFSDLRQGSRISCFVKACAASIASGWIGIAEMKQIFFISTAAGSDLDSRINDLGMRRNPGTQATGAVLGFLSSGSATITAGTLLMTSDQKVILEVAQSRTIAPPFTAIPVIATQVGAIGNLAAGIIVKPIDNSMPAVTLRVGSLGVDTNTNPIGPLTGGANAETDGQVRNRFPVYLKTLSLATLAAVKQAIAAIPGITSFVVQNQTPGPGWITISLTDGSNSISTNLRNAVDQAMTDSGPAGMGYILQQIQRRNITFTATAYTKDVTLSPALIQSNVAAALSSYTNTLGLGDSISFADLYSVTNLNYLEDIVISSPTESIQADPGELLGISSINVTVVYV